MVFIPNSPIVRAANRLFLCDKCMTTSYGSCDLFKEYVLNKKVLKKASLWSNIVEEKAKHSVSITDLIVPGSICAIAAYAKSPDTLWFVEIDSSESKATPPQIDDYGNTVIPGHPYFEGRFLEKASEKKYNITYHITPKKTFVYSSSVVYPFWEFEACNDETFTITNTGYCDILAFVEESGMSSL